MEGDEIADGNSGAANDDFSVLIQVEITTLY